MKQLLLILAVVGCGKKEEGGETVDASPKAEVKNPAAPLDVRFQRNYISHG
jgi:hypothetical protein